MTHQPHGQDAGVRAKLGQILHGLSQGIPRRKRVGRVKVTRPVRVTIECRAVRSSGVIWSRGELGPQSAQDFLRTELDLPEVATVLSDRIEEATRGVYEDPVSQDGDYFGFALEVRHSTSESSRTGRLHKVRITVNLGNKDIIYLTDDIESSLALYFAQAGSLTIISNSKDFTDGPSEFLIFLRMILAENHSQGTELALADLSQHVGKIRMPPQRELVREKNTWKGQPGESVLTSRFRVTQPASGKLSQEPLKQVVERMGSAFN